MIPARRLPLMFEKGLTSRRMFRTSPILRTVYESVLDTIGRTPVVNISKVLPSKVRDRGVQLYGKLEYLNPLGSVKDRLALGIILDAESSGALKPGMTVLEGTSGNTGIALAMICANKGYPFVAVMSENYSIERRKIMRALGAKVILTPAREGAVGMNTKAQELVEKHGWFWAQQFDNNCNPRYHSWTTGAEILRDFANRKLDYWITGYGTGGTFKGAGELLRRVRPETQIVLVEPDVAAMVQSGRPQERTADGNLAPHPAHHPHIIQGMAPNFIPRFCSEGVHEGIASRVVSVTQEEAVKSARNLAQKEGVFGGISGGATTAAALQVAETAAPGSVILAMIPDTQERYQSTVLYEDVPENMTEEEYRLSRSTPSCQL